MKSPIKIIDYNLFTTDYGLPGIEVELKISKKPFTYFCYRITKKNKGHYLRELTTHENLFKNSITILSILIVMHKKDANKIIEHLNLPKSWTTYSCKE